MPNAEKEWTRFYQSTPCYVTSQLVNSTFTCPQAATPWIDARCAANNGFNSWNQAGCCDCKYINYKYPAPNSYTGGSFRFVYGWVCLFTFIMLLVAYMLLLAGAAASRLTPGQRSSGLTRGGYGLWKAGIILGGTVILGQFLAFSIWYSYVTMIGFNVLGYTRYFALAASRTGVMLHVLAGAAWMLGVTWQFLPYARRHYKTLHHIVGYFTVVCLLAAALGLFLLVSSSHFGGYGTFFAGWTFGLYWVFCVFHGVLSIRQRRVQAHRIWMIRTVYLGVGIIMERAPQGLILKYLPLTSFLGANYSTLLAGSAYSTILTGSQALYNQWLMGSTFWWCEAWSVFLGEAYLYLAYNAGLFTTVVGAGSVPPVYLLPTAAASGAEDDQLALPPVETMGWKTAILGEGEHNATIDMPRRGRAMRQVVSYLDHSMPLTFDAWRPAGRNAKLLYLTLPHPYMSFGAAPGHDLAITATVKGKGHVCRTYTPIILPPEIAELDPLMTPSTVMLLVKHVHGGPMTNHLLNLAPGQHVLAEGGLGAFEFSPGAYGHIGIIAGGSGITGVLSVMTAALCDPWDTSRIDLVYVNSSYEDILMKAQLDGMAKLYNDRLTITYIVTNNVIVPRQAPGPDGDLLFLPRARQSMAPPAARVSAVPHHPVVVAHKPAPPPAPKPPPPPPVPKPAPADSVPSTPIGTQAESHSSVPPAAAAPVVLAEAEAADALPVSTPPESGAEAEVAAAPAAVPVAAVAAPVAAGFLASVVAAVKAPLSPTQSVEPRVVRQPAKAPPAPIPLTSRPPPGPLTKALQQSSGGGSSGGVTPPLPPPAAPFPPPAGPSAAAENPELGMPPPPPAAAGGSKGVDSAALDAKLAAIIKAPRAAAPAAVVAPPSAGDVDYIPLPAAAYFLSPRTTMTPVTSPKASLGGASSTGGAAAATPVPAAAFATAVPNGLPAAHPKEVELAKKETYHIVPLPLAAPPAIKRTSIAPAHGAGLTRQSAAAAPPPPPPAPAGRPAFLSNLSTTKVVGGALSEDMLAETPLVTERGKHGRMQLLICGTSGFNFNTVHAMARLGHPRSAMWAFGTSDR